MFGKAESNHQASADYSTTIHISAGRNRTFEYSQVHTRIERATIHCFCQTPIIYRTIVNYKSKDTRLSLITKFYFIKKWHTLSDMPPIMKTKKQKPSLRREICICSSNCLITCKFKFLRLICV